MTRPARRIVLSALAASLILAPVEAPAQPDRQQVQERRSMPSPLKILRRAFDRMRQQGSRNEQARRGKPADQPGTPRPTASRAAEPPAARLPRPRPASPASPTSPAAAAEALADSSDPVDSSAAVRMLLAAEPAKAAPPSIDLIEMPESFASAGLDAASGILPVPDVVPPRRETDALAQQSPSLLAPVPYGAVHPAPLDAVSAIDVLARVPRPRPGQGSAVLARVDPQSGPASDAGPLVAPEPEPEDPACLSRLRELGVSFSQQSALGEGGCLVPHPLKVTSLGSGVAITPAAILNCRTAEALALWVRDSLVPAGRTFLGAAPTEIAHGSTYVCRTRNNQQGAKLSEHATANAVDIASIGFAGRAPLAIQAFDPTAPEGRFAATVRRESCAYFTTVLGPGTNAAHAEHFHFDMAQRSRGYRLCDLGEPAAAEEGGKAPIAARAPGQ